MWIGCGEAFSGPGVYPGRLVGVAGEPVWVLPGLIGTEHGKGIEDTNIAELPTDAHIGTLLGHPRPRKRERR